MKFLFLIEDCIRRKHPHTYENYINKGNELQQVSMTTISQLYNHNAQ